MDKNSPVARIKGESATTPISRDKTQNSLRKNSTKKDDWLPKSSPVHYARQMDDHRPIGKSFKSLAIRKGRQRANPASFLC